MSTLFVLPHWALKSEVWMTRMVQALGQDISHIACENPPESNADLPWKFVPLKQNSSILFRTLREMGALSCGIEQTALEKAALDPRVKQILVNYLPFALKYEGVWQKAKKPLFIHCHGYDITWDLQRRSLWRPRVHPSDYKARVLRLSSIGVFIVNSEHSRRKLLDLGILKSRIVIRPFGVPSNEVFHSRKGVRKAVKILFIGRLVDFKGPDLLIKAFELATEMGMSAELILGGNGAMRPMCESMRQRSQYKDRIKLLGAVSPEEADVLRREADIFSAHSCKGRITNQEEALGVAFLEAMAAGLPVVTGRSGGIPEYIENQKTGILFEPGDIQSHADALRTLASDPALREAIGSAAWRHVRANFSLEMEKKSLRKILGLDSFG